ncbi:recombinase family protein [Tepidibacter sp. Z1-5]|uniref:recombinase family protein n=1 Tax=Tepidibacter sp. Z1-5 TaxID=3134138 RepID=UPI0030C425DF
MSKSSISKNSAIAYLRVSTKKQEQEGNSIEIQKKAAIKYAKECNLNIIEFLEESKSASKVSNPDLDIQNNLYESLDSRPQLQKVLNLIKNKKVQHLIVFTKDRLARNLELSISLDYFFNKNKVTVHYTSPGEVITTNDNKISKFLSLVFASIGELEANLISSRVKGGLEETVRCGYWPGGQPPYGYVLRKVTDKKSILHPSLLEINNVKKIFDLYTSYGYSYRAIANKMNQLDNVDIWTKGKIESIINNETYTGYITWNRRSRSPDNKKEPIKSVHKEASTIINALQWKNSLKLRESKSKSKDHKYYSTPFLLRDKLVCGKCNEIMKAKNYGKDRYGNQREGVYRCINKNSNNRSELIVKKEHIENKFIKEMSKMLSAPEIDLLWINYQTSIKQEKENNENEIDRIDKEIENTKVLCNKLKDLLDEDTPDSSFEKIIFNEHIQLKKKLQSLKNNKKSLKNLESKYFKTQIELQTHIDRFFMCDFKKLEQERKRMLIDIIVDKVILSKNGDDVSMKIIVNKFM